MPLPILLTVDDDPEVSRSPAQDLRQQYGEGTVEAHDPDAGIYDEGACRVLLCPAGRQDPDVRNAWRAPMS